MKSASYSRPGVLALVAAMILSLPSVAAASPPRGDTPVIAEPMIFDLVRGLGARFGEQEVNTLVRMRGDNLEWAPEYEVMIADHHGLELEFPMHNTALEALKIAYQGTIGTAFDNRMIHGVQTIGEYMLADRSLHATGLYLLGYRFNERWSTLLMGGGQLDTAGGQPSALFNGNVFADITAQFLVGLETNTRYNNTEGLTWLIMPQARWDLFEVYHLQFGMGATGDATGIRPMSAMRLSLDF